MSPLKLLLIAGGGPNFMEFAPIIHADQGALWCAGCHFRPDPKLGSGPLDEASHSPNTFCSQSLALQAP